MEDPRKVQHVNRASSDQLLHKFADLESKSAEKSEEATERRRRRSDNNKKKKRARADDSDDVRGINVVVESPAAWRNGSLVVEMKSLLLLPPTPQPPSRTTISRSSSALLRGLGFGRQELRVREIIISRSLLKNIEKTWHKTMEGASKMFMEKHCNQHMRLRNEVV